MVWALQLANKKVGLMCNISAGTRKNVKETLINVYFISLWRESEREREKSTQNTYLCTDFNNFKTYIYYNWMGSSTSQYKSRVTVRMYVRNALKMYACVDKLQVYREEKAHGLIFKISHPTCIRIWWAIQPALNKVRLQCEFMRVPA